MDAEHDRQDYEELSGDEAVAEVANCARRLFATVSAQQARDLASVVLRDLRARGVRLVRVKG